MVLYEIYKEIYLYVKTFDPLLESPSSGTHKVERFENQIH
jgi:hypothetical protein